MKSNNKQQQQKQQKQPQQASASASASGQSQKQPLQPTPSQPKQMDVNSILNELERKGAEKGKNEDVFKQLSALVGNPSDKAGNYELLVHAGNHYLKSNERDEAERFFKIATLLNRDMMPAWNGLAEALTVRFTSTTISKENFIEVSVDLAEIKLEQARIAKSKGNQKNLKDNLIAASGMLMNILVTSKDPTIDLSLSAIKCFRILSHLIITYTNEDFQSDIDKAKSDLIALTHQYPLVIVESVKKADLTALEKVLFTDNSQLLQMAHMQKIFVELLQNYSSERLPTLSVLNLTEKYLTFLSRHSPELLSKECEILLSIPCISESKSIGANLLVRATLVSSFEQEISNKYSNDSLVDVDEQIEKLLAKVLQAMFLSLRDSGNLLDEDREVLNKVIWRAYSLQSQLRFFACFKTLSSNFEIECAKIYQIQREAVNWKSKAEEINNEQAHIKAKGAAKASKILFGSTSNKDLMGEKMPDIWNIVSEQPLTDLFVYLYARCSLYVPCFAQDSKTVAESVEQIITYVQSRLETGIKGRMQLELALCKLHCLVRQNSLGHDSIRLSNGLFSEKGISSLQKHDQFASVSYLWIVAYEYSIAKNEISSLIINENDVHPNMKSAFECCKYYMNIAHIYSKWKKDQSVDSISQITQLCASLLESCNKFSAIPMISDLQYFHPIFSVWAAKSQWILVLMGSGNADDIFKSIALTAKKIRVQDAQLFYLLAEYFLGMDRSVKMRHAFAVGLVYNHSGETDSVRDLSKAKQSLQKSLSIDSLYLPSAIALSSIIHSELEQTSKNSEDRDSLAREVALIYTNIVKVADNSQMDSTLTNAVVWAFTRMGQWQITNRRYDSSINYFQRALSFSPFRIALNTQQGSVGDGISNSSDYLQLRAVLDCWIGLGECHRALERYTSSKKVLEQACEVSEYIKDRKALSFAKHQIGLVCMKLSQFEESYNSYQTCLEILSGIPSDEVGDGINFMRRTCSEGLLTAMLGMIESYIKRGLVELASTVLQEAQGIVYSAIKNTSNQSLHILWKLAGDIESMKSTCLPLKIENLSEMNQSLKNETFRLARRNYAKSIYTKPWSSHAWQGLASHCAREHKFCSIHGEIIDNNNSSNNDDRKKWEKLPTDSALSVAESTICLDPADSESWSILASIYGIKKLSSNDPNDKMFEQHCLVRALQLDHGNKNSWQNLAWFYLHNHIPSLAKDAFAEAKLDIWAGHVHLKAFEGLENEIDRKYYSQALAYAIDSAGFGLNGAGYDSSIKLAHFLTNGYLNEHPDQHSPWNSEVSSSNWIRILDVIKYCVLSDPLSAQAWNLQGLAFEAQGNYNKALESFMKSLSCLVTRNDESIASKREILHRNISRCLISLGKAEDAIKQLESIPSPDPSTMFILARGYISLPNASKEHAAKAVDLLKIASSKEVKGPYNRVISIELIKAIYICYQKHDDINALIDSICVDIGGSSIEKLSGNERKELCSHIDQVISLLDWFLDIAGKAIEIDKGIVKQIIEKILSHVMKSSSYLHVEPVHAVRNVKVIANAFDLIGNSKKARNVLLTAIKIHPYEVSSWSNLSVKTDKEGESSASFTAARNALALANLHHSIVEPKGVSLYESATMYAKHIPNAFEEKHRLYWSGSRVQYKIRHAYPWLYKNQ